MKSKIGFYLDVQKLGSWDFESFLRGDVGMSGTDGQLLLLVNDLAEYYDVVFFADGDVKEYKNIKTIKADDLADAAKMAKTLPVDVFIFNNKGDDGIKRGITMLDKLGLPFIMWDHNGPTGDFEAILAGSRFLKRIVCVSKNQANWHRHRRFFNKVTYVHNGQDYVARAVPADSGNGHHIGYIGAVSESKGFHWVAKAWPQVRQAFPDATLTVIGSIKTHDRTRVTGDLGVAVPEFEDKYIKPYLGNDLNEIKANGVNFTGHISPNEMPVFMDRLNLGIVNPNMDGSNETFCLSAIDFQAYHVPVIGANTGGLKETIQNGKTGLLINDSNKLADAVIKLLNDKKQLLFLKNNSSKWVKDNFARSIIKQRWIKLIDDVLQGKQNKMVSFDIHDVNLKLIGKEMVRIKNKLSGR